MKWRYAEPESVATSVSVAIPAGALPPDALLEPLRAAANRGDIVAVRRELIALRASHPEHAGFVTELEALAAAYQMTALRRRLNPAEPAG
jgi:hypothetical protein